MRIDDFDGKYAHGFSIALDPVLCCVGLKEPSAVGFRIVSDTLLFYRIVQGHFRQLRFWAWYGSTSGHLTFVNAIPTKAPPFQTNSEGRGTPKVRIGGWTTRPEIYWASRKRSGNLNAQDQPARIAANPITPRISCSTPSNSFDEMIQTKTRQLLLLKLQSMRQGWIGIARS